MPDSPGGGTNVNDFNTNRKSQYPATKTVNGVTYRHIGQGVYEDPVTGERGRIYDSGGGKTYTDPLSGQVITEPGGLKFDPLPADFQPWNAPGAGGGTDMRPREFDDPRYWDLQYQKLYQDALNMGLDADSARRQALSNLIQSRNSLAANTAQTSASVAESAARFAAEPKDSVAELMFRNSVGGATPFGSVSSNPGAAGQFGSALEQKFMELFGGVGQDLQASRAYRDAIPLPEFLQTAGVNFEGASSPAAAAAPAPAPTGGNDLAGALQFIQALNSDPAKKEAFVKYVTPPKMDMGGIVNARSAPGEAPTSTEGGLNLNLFEPAVVMGMDSGKIYATLAEPRPDGTRRGEQLIVKPLKSEVEKDKKLADGQKAVTQSFGVPSAAGGGAISSIPGVEDFMQQLSEYLGNLGGSGGGTGGYESALPDARLLAGAPWSSLLEDPDALDMTFSGYKAGPGGVPISPRQLAATVAKFEPAWLKNNAPRVVF